jgi:glycosyltransferase involved in cell wall biosynthesis|tara:strand:- start:106 stop:738 length:633 start_codon:yes stop_codon:yes gene_type:complete
MFNDLVSVVITNYNYGKYLSRAIRSCLSQKHLDVEILVVDDNSNDESDKVLETFSFLPKEKFRVIKSDKNRGVAHCSNLGLENSIGRFFIRVDSDDFISPETCYFLKTYLQKNREAFCVSCDYWLVDDYENKIERKYAKEKNISCGIMYRRDLLLELGGYNADMRHKEEEELRKRLGEKYKIHHLEIPFYRYRMHSHNKTKSKEYSETKI